ncbi:MAG: hypothetical protein QM581_16495 [Pseudomonas sp.]
MRLLDAALHSDKGGHYAFCYADQVLAFELDAGGKQRVGLRHDRLVKQ